MYYRVKGIEFTVGVGKQLSMGEKGSIEITLIMSKDVNNTLLQGV